CRRAAAGDLGGALPTGEPDSQRRWRAVLRAVFTEDDHTGFLYVYTVYGPGHLCNRLYQPVRASVRGNLFLEHAPQYRGAWRHDCDDLRGNRSPGHPPG